MGTKMIDAFAFAKLLFFFCGFFIQISDGGIAKTNRVINMNPKLGRWPSAEIPFYIDSAYSVDEAKQIRLAILKVMADIDMCVRFKEVLPTDTQYKVKITPLDRDEKIGAVFTKLCHSFSGVFLPGLNEGKTEQSVVLANGPDGCFDGSMHSLMKYFAVLMGLRNEHQRPDRDSFIQVAQENILPDLQMAYRAYQSSEIYVTCPYDYCSITHNQPEDFAKPGSSAFVVKQAPFFIPKLENLSTCDCAQLKALYGCDPASCRQVDCANQTVKAAEGSATGSPLDQSTTVCYSVPSSQIGTTVSFSTVIPASDGIATTPTSGMTTCTVNATVTTVDATATTVSSSSSSSSDSTTSKNPAGPIGLASNSSSADNVLPAVPSPEEGSLPPVPSPDDSNVNSKSTSSPLSDARRRKRNVGSISKTLRIINADPDFLKWAQNTVPFYIDNAYTPEQRAQIIQAIQTVTTELHGCITFRETPQESPEYKLKITPFDDNPLNQGLGCRTIPGVSQVLVANGRTEQPMVLSTGSNGCFDGNLGNLMKYFVLVLGRRNEHQRPDRDLYIDVNFDNIIPGLKVAYGKYSSSSVSASLHPYDYCSITHNEPDDFAVAGKATFTIKNSQIPTIPKLDRLSESDCRIVSDIYGCPATSCTPLDCIQLAMQGQTLVSNATPPAGLFIPFSSMPATVTPNEDGSSRVCLKVPSSSSETTLTATTLIPHDFKSGTLSASVTTTTTCVPKLSNNAVSGNSVGPAMTTPNVNISRPSLFGQMYEQLQNLVNQVQEQINNMKATTVSAGVTTAPTDVAGTSQTSSTNTGTTTAAKQPLIQQLNQLIEQLQQQIARQSTSTSSGSTVATSEPTASEVTTTTATTGAESAATVTTTASTTGNTQTSVSSPETTRESGKEGGLDSPIPINGVFPPPPDHEEDPGKISETHPPLPLHPNDTDDSDHSTSIGAISNNQFTDETVSSIDLTTSEFSQSATSLPTDTSVTATSSIAQFENSVSTGQTSSTDLGSTVTSNLPSSEPTSVQPTIPPSTISEQNGLIPSTAASIVESSTTGNPTGGTSEITETSGATLNPPLNSDITRTTVGESRLSTGIASTIATIGVSALTSSNIGSTTTEATNIGGQTSTVSTATGSSMVPSSGATSSITVSTTHTRSSSMASKLSSAGGVTTTAASSSHSTRPSVTTTTTTKSTTSLPKVTTTLPAVTSKPSTTTTVKPNTTTKVITASVSTTQKPSATSTVKPTTSTVKPTTTTKVITTSVSTTQKPSTTTTVKPITTTEVITTPVSTPQKLSPTSATSVATKPKTEKNSSASTISLPVSPDKNLLQQMGANLNNMLGQINGATDSSGNKPSTPSYKEMQNSVQEMIKQLASFTQRPATGLRPTTHFGQKFTPNPMFSKLENAVQQMINQLGARTTPKPRKTTPEMEHSPPPPPPF